MRIMTFCSEKADKKTAREKRRKQAEDKSPGLLFVQMTKAEMMKRGLCFECGEHGHRANQTKNETSAADEIQAAQIDNQEQVHSWMNN